MIGGNLWAIAIVPLFFMWHWLQLKSNEIMLIAAFTLLGALNDSLLLNLGLLSFPEHSSALIPVWLILLWSAFAATLLHSMTWLMRKPVLAILLGAVGGPWSYYAGSLLNSLSLSYPVLIIIALVWATLLGTVSLIIGKHFQQNKNEVS